jgi:hypothetical protein
MSNEKYCPACEKDVEYENEYCSVCGRTENVANEYLLLRRQQKRAKTRGLVLKVVGILFVVVFFIFGFALDPQRMMNRAGESIRAIIGLTVIVGVLGLIIFVPYWLVKRYRRSKNGD